LLFSADQQQHTGRFPSLFSADQQQDTGQPPLLLTDGCAASSIGAAVRSDQASSTTASTDAALTTGQEFVRFSLVLQRHAAVLQRDGARVAALCSCLGAGQLSHTEVRDLLHAAVGVLSHTRLFLPAAKE
jgi:hypothetical protein